MEVMYESVSGLDVHKKTVVACVRRVGAGGRVWKEVRTFATMTHNLLALKAWLKEHGVTHVAMEEASDRCAQPHAPRGLTRYHVGKLQALGHQVKLIAVEDAA